MRELEAEKESCRTFCEYYYPENPQRLFDWFGEQQEKFSFGMGTATDDELNDGHAPSPVILRQGDMLYFSIGVESGKEEFTQKRIFQRHRYELNLVTWERKEVSEWQFMKVLPG